MTTVAVDAKLKFMAADKQVTFTSRSDNGPRALSRNKIKHIIHRDDEIGECLIACSGMSEVCEAFVEWFSLIDSEREKLKRKKCPTTNDFEAIVLLSDGSLWWYGKNWYPVELKERYFAIGSGSNYALGALHAGATVVEAVKIASKLDPNSGMGVQVERIKDA